MDRIVIDPACNYSYSSFYIKGIVDLFPGKVFFSSDPFLTLKYGPHTHIFAFIIIEGTTTKRIVIDFADSDQIYQDFLNWSDIYGKINLRSLIKTQKDAHKIRSIAPGYGIRLLDKPSAVLMALINFLKCHKRTVDFRSYLSNYLSTTNRLPLFSEPDNVTTDNYVFFLSTYWESQEITNHYRLNFIKACRNLPNVNFEGGLVLENTISNRHPDEAITNLRLDYKEYIAKTKKSRIVFNTPAYHLCHGWKLAEYMALGKAIISTPINNLLPEPLEHERNIYFVTGETSDIEDAIKLLLSDHELRKKLEKGAYEYYINYIQPKQSINLLLS
jgi:glycosyltransferase involved in cell wall biosynthesis